MAQLPGPLVDAGWLSSVLEDPAVRVVDVRWSPTGGTEDALHAYEDGHVPGAAFMDVDRDLSAAPFEGGPGRHPLPSPEAFSDSMASVGLGDDSIVVAYDDVHGSLAARLWWMLQATGHRVAVLDGGLPAWVQDGGAIERGAMTPRGRGSFSTSPWPSDRIVDADAVVSTIRTGEAPVLDVRAAERYRGEAEPIDPVAGHIPGARSLPWTENLDEHGRFLPAGNLRARYAAAGVTGDAAIAHCGSGLTACHTLLALHVAGFGDARLYEGSWSDWIHDPERPVATGPEPR